MLAPLKIHRGNVLKAEVKKRREPIAKLTRAAGYKTNTFHFHTKQEDLSLDILYKYGEAMNCDFSLYIPEMNDYLIANGLKKNIDNVETCEEIRKDRDNYKQLYIDTLRSYSLLLLEKLKS